MHLELDVRVLEPCRDARRKKRDKWNVHTGGSEYILEIKKKINNRDTLSACKNREQRHSYLFLNIYAGNLITVQWRTGEEKNPWITLSTIKEPKFEHLPSVTYWSPIIAV